MTIGVTQRTVLTTIPAMATPCATYMAAVKTYYETMGMFPMTSPLYSRFLQYLTLGALNFPNLQFLSALSLRINGNGVRLSTAAAAEGTVASDDVSVMEFDISALSAHEEMIGALKAAAELVGMAAN